MTARISRETIFSVLDALEETSAPSVRRPYCLRCYAPMEAFTGPSHVCERCRFVNLRLDQQQFWTKEHDLRQVEVVAKGAIVLLVVGLALAIVRAFGDQVSFGMGQGWAVGFPIVVGLVLWETASKITRRSPTFRALLVWRVVLGVLGVGAWVLGTDLGLHDLRGVLWLLLGPCLLGAALALGPLARALARWRDRRILAGQRTSV